MILIFCFNNLFEFLKKFFWCSWGNDEYIIMADISKALRWNLIEQFVSDVWKILDKTPK